MEGEIPDYEWVDAGRYWAEVRVSLAFFQNGSRRFSLGKHLVLCERSGVEDAGQRANKQLVTAD